jgi:hypothetical protein
MATWQNNLNTLLNSRGNYPFQKWNDQLYHWCRSWADILNDNRGFSATVTTQYPLSVTITVKRNGMSTTSFICQIYYRGEEGCEPSMVINSVKSFDYAGYVRALPNDDTLPFYSWDNDEISGEEIFHEGFITETITIAFSKYLDATGNTIN